MAGASENEGYSSFLYGLTESEIHTRNLPDDIGTRWKDLARKLGFNEAFIDAIESEKDSNKECCIALLVKWMEKEGEQGATREKLATALTNIGLQNLADRLIGPLNMCRNGTMPTQVEKAIKLDDGSQIMLATDSTGKKKFLVWESEENEFETLFEDLKNSVNATIQISVNTPEETKIIKTSEVKDLDISAELKSLQEKLSNIIRNLEMGELKEESFPIQNKVDLLNRQSRTLQELYTKVTGMTGEACKCDELVRRNFYDFTYHSLRAVHNDLRARTADLQSAEPTLKEEEKETLRKILSYQKGREKQVEHLEKLWIGLFTPMKPPLKKSQSSPPVRELGKPPSDAKNVRAYSDTATSKGDSTKWTRSRKYSFTSTREKSEDNCPILLSFWEAGKEK